MGWIIGVGIGFLFGCLISWAESKKPNEGDFYANPIIASIVVAMIWGVIGGIFAGVESGKIDRHDDPVAEGCTSKEHIVPIISTTREKRVSGSFILGTGGVGTVDKYYAYVETERGLMLKRFWVDDTYIIEGSAEPHYKRIDWYCERTFRNWFWFGEREPRRNKGRWGQLHVPENTILREFKL